MSTLIHRRQFVAAAAGAMALGPALHLSGKEPPSGRVRIGLIGCGGRGRELLAVLQERPDVEIPVISDVIEPRMDAAAKLLSQGPQAKKPECVVEHERILERPDIDAVLIATAQHWHGIPMIQAVKAGKHVYVEKPLSHTAAEGRAMADAAKKSQGIVLAGTQQRGYPHFQKAVEVVRSGRLGRIALVECWNSENNAKRVGRPPDADPPAGYHWDRWLGPAPLVPFNPARLNHAWWFDYSCGMLTNWTIHYLDIALWAMHAGWPTSVACNGGKMVVDDLADTPDLLEAAWRFPDFVLRYSYRGFNAFRPLQNRPSSHGICFYGNQATLVLDRNGYELWEAGNAAKPAEKEDNPRHWRDGKPGNEVDGPWQWMFVDCIKNGKPLPLDFEDSHRSNVCCHLANVSYLTGRTVRWNGRDESVVDDAEASKRLSRPRRKGYELPAA